MSEQSKLSNTARWKGGYTGAWSAHKLADRRKQVTERALSARNRAGPDSRRAPARQSRCTAVLHEMWLATEQAHPTLTEGGVGHEGRASGLPLWHAAILKLAVPHRHQPLGVGVAHHQAHQGNSVGLRRRLWLHRQPDPAVWVLGHLQRRRASVSIGVQASLRACRRERAVQARMPPPAARREDCLWAAQGGGGPGGCHCHRLSAAGCLIKK